MTRIALTVTIDLDPVPGTFHEPEDHHQHLQRMLDDAYPWYHPHVSLGVTIHKVTTSDNNTHAERIFTDAAIADVWAEHLNTVHGGGYAWIENLTAENIPA